MNRLQEKYKNEVVPQLMKEFNYTSIMQVPKIDKVVVNIGVGDAIQNAKLPARLRLSLKLKSLSQTSSFVKVCLSVVK